MLSMSTKCSSCRTIWKVGLRELRDDLYQDVSRRSNEEVAAISQEEMVTNLQSSLMESTSTETSTSRMSSSFVVSKAGMTNTISLDAITEYEETLHDAKLRSAQNKPLAGVYYPTLDAVAIGMRRNLLFDRTWRTMPRLGSLNRQRCSGHQHPHHIGKNVTRSSSPSSPGHGLRGLVHRYVETIR